MTKYLNAQGKIVEKTGLEDILEQQAPELAAKHDAFVEKWGDTKSYVTYLYTTPLADESKIAALERERWNGWISLFDAQHELEKNISTVELFKNVDGKNIGDKVLVLSSQRPLVDTVLADEPVGESQAWIGKLVSNDITNIEGSEFFSLDGLIYRRVVLEEARKVPKKLFEKWSIGEIDRIYSGNRYRDTHTASVNELKALPLGKKKLTLYEPYQQTDIYCVEHYKTEIEKLAESVEDSGYFSFAKDYQEKFGKHIMNGPWSRIGKLSHGYEDPDSEHKWLKVLVGEDKRSPEEVYFSVRDELQAVVKDITKKYGVKDLRFFVVKKLQHYLTKEDEDIIENSFNPTDVLTYKLRDAGYHITDETVLSFYFDSKHDDKGEVRKEFFDAIEPKLPGYTYAQKSLSVGFGSSLTDQLIVKTDSLFFFDLDNYIGETVTDFFGEPWPAKR